MNTSMKAVPAGAGMRIIMNMNIVPAVMIITMSTAIAAAAVGTIMAICKQMSAKK